MKPARRQPSAADEGVHLLQLLRLLRHSEIMGQSAALLMWHQLYGWPALRAIDRQWPQLRSVQ